MIRKDLEEALNEMDPKIIDTIAKMRCEKHLKKEVTMSSNLSFKRKIIIAAIAATLAIAAVMIPLAVMMNKAPDPATQPPVATNSAESKTEKQTTPTDVQPGTPTNVDPTKPTDDPTTTPIVTSMESNTTMSSANNYVIKETTDGVFYMIIEESVKPQNNQEEAGVRFSTLAEFRSAMKEHEFTEDQVRQIKAMIPTAEFGKNHELGVKLYDYNGIFEPKFPTSYTLQEGVVWDSEGYSFILNGSNNDEFCVFDVMTKDEYAKVFDQFEQSLTNSTITLDRVEENEGKCVYYYHTGKAELKSVRYAFEKDGYVYTVEEKYRLTNASLSANTLENVPIRINVFVTNDIIHFAVTINNPSIAYKQSVLSEFFVSAIVE